jgi:hypothetical protein
MLRAKHSIMTKLPFTALALTMLTTLNCHAQSISSLTVKIEQLTRQRNAYDDSIRSLTKMRDTFVNLEKNHKHIIHTKVSDKTVLLESKVYGKDFLGTLNPNDSITIYNHSAEGYTIRSGQHVGIIQTISLKDTKQLKKYRKLLENERDAELKQRTRQNSYSNSSGSYQSSGSRSSSYHSIKTGPRGGKYYINSKGKKTYVKKR